jgi:hypothetical protein
MADMVVRTVESRPEVRLLGREGNGVAARHHRGPATADRAHSLPPSARRSDKTLDTQSFLPVNVA